MSQHWQDPYGRRPVDINAYAPPRRTAGWVWFLLAGAVALGVVLAALFMRPTATVPTPSPTPSPTAGATSAAPGMPFTMPHDTASQGRWEIIERTWEGNAVILRVRVTCDTGNVSYGFVAFSNAGTEVYEPVTGAPDPEIGMGYLRGGESIEGYLRIAMPHGPATLILTTAMGTQMSALPIAG